MLRTVKYYFEEIIGEIDAWWNLSRFSPRQFYWKLEHRFNPAHRYHIMDTGLEPGYYDPDVRILHAVMEEACSYLENTCGVIDWTGSEQSEQKFMELLEIYEYWEWRKNFNTTFGLGICDHLDPGYGSGLEIFNHRNEPEVEKYFECLHKLDDTDEAVAMEDREMLRRVINILPMLWYP